MEQKEKLEILFGKYLNGECNADELAELLQHFHQSADSSVLRGLIMDELVANRQYDAEMQHRIDKVVAGTDKFIASGLWPGNKEIHVDTPWYQRSVFYRWVAAAVIILSCAFAWFMVLHKVPEPQIMASAYGGDIPPGGNRAVLTLADGSSIDLDSAAKGTLLRQNGITITKTGDGQIVYEAGSEELAKTGTSYNVISTPKGGQYKIILPDGSKVWLNAASSLRYPVAFTGKERRVSLTGEGYFEVAKNPGKPFIAVSGGYEVRVLGTHFNVNTYDNEPTAKITLLEGSVTVNMNNTSQPVTLKPGQQVGISGGLKGGIPVLETVDTESAVAWKNGVFDTEGMDIQSIMRQVARWYDVEVIYQGTIPPSEFSGKIHRSSKLSQVLDVLSYAGIHFRIEGRKIIVTP